MMIRKEIPNIELLPDATICTDSDGRILLVNFLASKLFGYDKHELVGKDARLLIPFEYLEHHIQGGLGKIRPIEGLHQNGNKLDLRATISEWSTKDDDLNEHYYYIINIRPPNGTDNHKRLARWVKGVIIAGVIMLAVVAGSSVKNYYEIRTNAINVTALQRQTEIISLITQRLIGIQSDLDKSVREPSTKEALFDTLGHVRKDILALQIEIQKNLQSSQE